MSQASAQPQPITSSPCSTQWPALLLPLRLEVRRIEDALCIRVFPDQPFVNSHKEDLTQEEFEAGKKLCDLFTNGQLPPEKIENARDEWAELARRYGPNRAAWILESLLRGTEGVTISEAAAIPKLLWMPERFVFMVYENGHLVYQKNGRPIAGPFSLLPASTNDTSPPTDGLFDEDSKWVNDFPNAVAKGLGIRISLLAQHRAADQLHFSEIVVVGLAVEGETFGIQAFEQLVQTHRFTDGLEFLPYGTPTNNTQQGPSAHSASEDEVLASFDFEVMSPPGVTTPWTESAATTLRTALGLPIDTVVFNHIKAADLAPQTAVARLLRALWPCTGDYFLSTMLGYERFYAGRTMLRDYVAKYLRPAGHLATLRVGNLPFGVLPASRIKLASVQDKTGWKPSDSDHVLDDQTQNWSGLDTAILRVLQVLLPLWLERAKDSAVVPRAGASGDPDDELVRLLGMSPQSLDYKCRPIVDQTLIGLLLLLLEDSLFGINSGFWGLADPQTAVSTWASEWQQDNAQRWALLGLLQAAQFAKTYPLLLRTFTWGDGIPLPMDLVRVPPPPPGTTAPADGPETYLPIFVQGGPVPPSGSSKTLLFELLRRSSALEPQLPPAMRDVSAAVQELRDYPIVEFFDHTGTPAALAALAARGTPIADANAAIETLAGQPSGGYGTADAIKAKMGSLSGSDDLFNSLASRLRYDFSSRLETGLRDVLDSLTYRLDAWYTSLAARRLAAMRASQTTAEGLHWGAYGYLEDVRLRRHSVSSVEAGTGGGFIHAPTIAQASAAAVLRSAFESHRNDENGNAYAVNLTSRRVNRALALIDGVQQGQDLSALLGYQFEQGLHDSGLDRVIDDFRTSFPTSAPEDEDTAEAAESIGARDVCDGHALATAYSTGDPKIDAAVATLDPDDQETARGILKDLIDANDAVGDLLLYEGVFQAVQGNVERSGAALDACAGIGKPPEIESVTTPNAGPVLRHRVCLFLPEAATPTTTARATAEPVLNAWAEDVFGLLSNISCKASFTPADNGAPVQYLTLADLDPAISTLDFLYICGTLPGGDGATELEARLRRSLRKKRSIATDSYITLALENATPGSASIADAMELGRLLLDFLGNVTVATPPSLTHPDEAPSPPFYAETVVTELADRAATVAATLALQQESLVSSDPIVVLRALDICAQYGVHEAIVDAEDDPSIVQRGGRVVAIVSKRLAAAAPLIDSASTAVGDARVQNAIAAFKALFGDSFVVVPTFDVSGLATERVAAFDGSTAVTPAEDRIWLWLQQVAETHPRVRRLETFLIAAEAWGDVSHAVAPSLKMAQLPRNPELAWQALSDDEMSGTPGRTSGVQSIVALIPSDVDVTPVRGFVIDEWTERMPAAAVSTGISFEYNQPASQAPQCFLLAVPGNLDDPSWSAEHLANIVRDTMDLAKVRLVDLDALPNTGGVLPALMFPITPAPIYLFTGYMNQILYNALP